MCLIVSQQENTLRIHNLLCPFRDHRAVVVDLFTIGISAGAVGRQSDMLIPDAPEIYTLIDPSG